MAKEGAAGSSKVSKISQAARKLPVLPGDPWKNRYFLRLFIAVSFDHTVSFHQAEFTRLGKIDGSSPGVVKEDFCQSPVVIGFGKFGFSGDGLVEVLQGQVVILLPQVDEGPVEIAEEEAGAEPQP